MKEILGERGSITRGGTLAEFDGDMIIEFETFDTQNNLGNLKPRLDAQRALNDLKSFLHNNKSWEVDTLGLGDALVKTMILTLNTLLPPAVMNSPSKVGLASIEPGHGPTAQLRAVHLWHWPLIVQMEVCSDDGTGPKMEEQTVRISLILGETGGWFVMKETVEALLTLWLFTLKQQRGKFVKLRKANPVMGQFVRLIGSNTELTRWDIIRWYIGHCSRMYEGNLITVTEAANNEKYADEIDIEIDRSLGQIMGIEQVDLRSEDELVKEREGGIHQSPTAHQAKMHWHYFRGHELPQILDEDLLGSRGGRYTSLAATTECTLEELCAQEIVFRFFFAIGTFMREEKGIRVLGNTTITNLNTNIRAATSSLHSNDDPERRLRAAKFHNSILERIALEAYQSKVCGSLEEAYQCLIPAFSQATVLPEVREVVNPQVTQIFRELVGKGDWIKACDLYNWAWDSMGCKFPHHSNEDLHAIALFTKFVRELRHEANTDCQEGLLIKQLVEKGEAMLKAITEKVFQRRDIMRALDLMLQCLDELDGLARGEMIGSELIEADHDSTPLTSRRSSQEESDGHEAPEGSEEAIPTGEHVRPGGYAEGGVPRSKFGADRLKIRKLKEGLEKLQS